MPLVGLCSKLLLHFPLCYRIKMKSINLTFLCFFFQLQTLTITSQFLSMWLSLTCKRVEKIIIDYGIKSIHCFQNRSLGSEEEWDWMTSTQKCQSDIKHLSWAGGGRGSKWFPWTLAGPGYALWPDGHQSPPQILKILHMIGWISFLGNTPEGLGGYSWFWAQRYLLAVLWEPIVYGVKGRSEVENNFTHR